MDESGVDVQVLSVTTPALHNLEAGESVRLAMETNDLVAATIAKHPNRFQGFAVLPMPAPDKAASELRRAVTQCGLLGARWFAAALSTGISTALISCLCSAQLQS